MGHVFVGLPRKEGRPDGKIIKTFLYDHFKETVRKTVRQVLWGDWLNVIKPDAGENMPDDWLKIHWAPNSDKQKFLYIPKSHTTPNRPLEIIFHDVGQGDGAVLITPERDEGEAIFLVDAGETDKMNEFITERFNTYKKKIQFHSAIITHPDKDHYLGFEKIFSNHNIGFDVVYQNGLVERPVSGTFEKVGGKVKDSPHKDAVKSLAIDKKTIEDEFSDSSNFGRRKFPPVMHAALNNPNIKDFKMLSTFHSTSEDNRNWMPGFAPSNDRKFTIEVIGPVVEFDSVGDPLLRVFTSNYGKFKNGHSILLRLHMGQFKVFFGGDLNSKAEKYLLKHYSGMDFKTRNNSNYKSMKDAAKVWLDSDIMKVCHHGSTDVTDEFLDVVGPGGFVISSGDEEGHVHPRPDLLGRLGKAGNSDAPVILSTELQRSTREKADAKLLKSLQKKLIKIKGLAIDDDSTEQEITDEFKTVDEGLKILGRSNVQVYGAIYLKTDGETLITAFKKETDSPTDKWFFFEYRRQSDGKLKAYS